MADYKTPQWLLPNEKNLAYPAAGAETGSGLSEDRHSLYSMDFDGTSYIDLNDNNIINGFTSVSFSFWVNVTTPGLYDGILCSRNGSDYILIFLDNVSGSDFKIKIQQNSTSGGSATITTSPTLTSGNWYNVVCAGTVGDKWDLYINGDNTGQVQGASNITAITQSADFLIGSDTLLAGRYLNGLIDEIALYNKALNQSEIDALSVADAPANIMALNEKPVAYYPLGEQAQMGSANWSFPNGSLQSHVIDFDGSTDYISAGSLSYITSNVFTISGWIKATTSPPTYMPLFNFQNSSGIGSKFNWNHGAAPILWYSGSTYKYFLSGPWRTDGLWHNVTLVIDRTTIGNSKLYVDGDEISGGTTSGSGSMVLNDLNLGYNPTTQFYDGEMSNVAIWNSDQTTNKDNIYNNGSPQSTYTVTPTAWWKLNASNSSYVYPWSLELNGSPDVGGSGDHAKVVSNALQVQDINTTTTSGKVDFLTREITGAYSGINVTGEFIIATASAGQSGATLYYKIDGGSWVQFQQQLDTSGTTTYAISGASGLTSTTSFQVKIEFETGDAGSASVTLNNISIGDLYTEDFTNQDGAGWDNDTYTPPPVDWTFIDTETPAPNYTSALSFDGALIDGININNDSSLEPLTSFTLSCWIKSETSPNAYAYPVYKESSDYNHVAYGFYLQGTQTIATTVTTNGVVTSDSIGDLRDDKWHHVVQTYDGSGMKVYLDGIQSGATKSITGNVDYSTTQTELYIGNTRRTSPSGYFSFKGDVSNVALFNTAIDAAGVSTLFNYGTPQTSISFSPTSLWKLDNTTTGIQDSVGSNNGTITGSVTQIATNVLVSNNAESDTLPASALIPSDLQFESPYSNYSLSFDGTDDYVDLGNLSSIGISNASAASVSMWFKKDGNGNYILFELKEGASRVAIQSYLSNSLYIYINGVSYNVATTVANNEWHNIILAFDGTGASNADRLKLYFNGSNITGGTYSGTVPTAVGAFTSSMTSNLGRTPTTAYFSGKIDETAIWSFALNQAQVSQVYNNGYPAELTSLSPASWWRLGEDAFFVSNVVTIPNKITGGPNGTGGGGDQSAFLVGDAPGSYANGSGTNLVVGDRIGDAPESTANSVSINMIPSNRISYPAGYVPTQVDNAFSMAFDGINDYIDAGTGSELKPNIVSCSVWIKGAANTAYNRILSQDGPTGGADGYGFYVTAATNEVVFAIKTDVTGTVTSSSSGVVLDGTWHHLVGTYDGSNVNIYVDGNIIGSPVAGTAVLSYGIGGLTIGCMSEPTALPSYLFTGNIDEVAIFDYALSARQIKQDIYEGTTTGGKTADLNNISNLTAPVAWYRMGD